MQFVVAVVATFISHCKMSYKILFQAFNLSVSVIIDTF